MKDCKAAEAESYFTKIKVTNLEGEAIVGAEITENNIRIDDSGRPIDENSGTGITDKNGELEDFLGIGPGTTNEPGEDTENDRQGIKNFVNETPVESQTTQVLTIKTPDGAVYRAEFDHNVTNQISVNGKKEIDSETNENGVNLRIEESKPKITLVSPAPTKKPNN
ncbi:MAG: hypothetical protein R2684_13530 [Pyrinomonadaceae bacterium]